jgi:hypothetical protein
MGVTTFCHEVFLSHPSGTPVTPQAISSSPLLQDKGYHSPSLPIISKMPQGRKKERYPTSQEHFLIVLGVKKVVFMVLISISR